MNLQTLMDALNLKVLTETQDFSAIQVKTGYTSDLLSCVMTGAKSNSVWVTLMAHGNIVAVSALLDLAAIIITENAQPDEETILKANEEGVVLLSTPQQTFNIVGRLWELGLRNNLD
ncbi:MAG: DRTGG domain-containing protein [Anaerolineaceae bacterium]|nr:DRTGG domain-containing protein [Anaerolineaceae bacterium]